jgi:hypothetical protein
MTTQEAERMFQQELDTAISHGANNENARSARYSDKHGLVVHIMKDAGIVVVQFPPSRNGFAYDPRDRRVMRAIGQRATAARPCYPIWAFPLNDHASN